MFNIVLLEPEKPSNTGNIGRSCLLTGSTLHLVRPFKFAMDDKTLRRTGLDYWADVDLVIHDSYTEFINSVERGSLYFATTKAHKYYNEVSFVPGDYIVFGKESKGIDDAILAAHRENCIKIPMVESSTRSLNLANSCNIILFEALRQQGFKGMA